MKVAEQLGARTDRWKGKKLIYSAWAEEHDYLYDAFEGVIEMAYARGHITDKEHDRLVCVAFYDYANFYHEDVDTLWDD